MTTLPFKLSVQPALGQFLLTVRGSMAASSHFEALFDWAYSLTLGASKPMSCAVTN